MAVVRARAEAKRNIEDPNIRFDILMKSFRNQVGKSGILQAYKKYQYYEKPSDKARREKRQKATQRFIARNYNEGEKEKSFFNY